MCLQHFVIGSTWFPASSTKEAGIFLCQRQVSGVNMLQTFPSCLSGSTRDTSKKLPNCSSQSHHIQQTCIALKITASLSLPARTEEHKHDAKCSGYCYLKRQMFGGMLTYSCAREHTIALTFGYFSLHKNSQSRHNVSPAFDPGHVLSSALALLLLPRRESMQQPGHRREPSPQPGPFCHEP